MDYSGAIEGQAVNTTQAATSNVPVTTVVSTTTTVPTQPSTTAVTPSDPSTTTTAASDPTTTTNAPTTTTTTTTNDNNNPSPTTSPSSTTPKPSNQDTSSSSTIVTTSKSYVRTLSEITSSSAVPVVAVTSSGNSVYTYTSTSYRIFSTSVPTMIEANQFASPSTVSSGAIAGIVVGCVAFVGILGAAGFFMLRKKNKKGLDVSKGPEPPTAGYNPYADHSPSMASRPFVPAYDPSKQEYGHYNYEPQPAYHQPSEPMMGYEAQSSYPVSYDAQHYPASETLVSYEQTYAQPPETMIRNVPDEKDYEHNRISRHVPDEK
ncbi:hypothetical protein G6F57_009150 [Rhizopus arrhizus]|uniref:Mid2 domain-containing protein n=1 Tax=Rhizopus oryzae TaxID=64495 RepID=A0A9P7BRI6_RHIOR|nr:hypothetical protein G6F23_012146 [Rhizopus arrhizus]KAG1397065.1 hypothetical protein G6F58_011593 [Rhizopus delemar]KAG0761477.1 hypothetical protein G6F24_007537 [Rhizopus arrhizus]KAG0775390.1 hypothetical protein G6F22_013338 [Rhizopus arrhizus]KAG0789469.1 hypothetical protein G6F21_006495 [Rhizopus arrhizus]